MMRVRFCIILFICCCACPSGQAQQLLKQTDLSKWHVPPANYSGIVSLGADSFAVVDDKSVRDGFYVFHIKQNTADGRIENVRRSALRADSSSSPYIIKPSSADCEDVAFVPEWRTCFVASECYQQVLEYDMSGHHTGRRLHVPELFSAQNIQNNGGFESLTYQQSSQLFWTTTEVPLPVDGGDSSGILRLHSFDCNLEPAFQYAYKMEPPALKSGTYYAHGVPALLALDDGRLLVMERELTVPSAYIGAKTIIRVFVVDPTKTSPVQTTTEMSTLSADKMLKKMELFHFTTRLKVGKLNYGNYEGMARGMTLDDGRSTLLLLCDSQAGAGNAFYRLKDYLKVVILPKDF